MKNSEQQTLFSDKETIVQDLIKENPDILLAQKIMDQARKTIKPSMQKIDQNNYYRIP